jgi:ribosome-binding protein aMBF1 (putative translation factor)
MAREAIEGWLKAELQARRVPPPPRSHRGGEWLVVRLDALLGVNVALRQARADAGLTQGQLAQRIGVSQQAIAKL